MNLAMDVRLLMWTDILMVDFCAAVATLSSASLHLNYTNMMRSKISSASTRMSGKMLIYWRFMIVIALLIVIIIVVTVLRTHFFYFARFFSYCFTIHSVDSVNDGAFRFV